MSDIVNHPSSPTEKPRWYLVRGNERHGPFPDSKLYALAGEDRIEPGDLVWRPGFLAWTQASEVSGLLTPPPLPQGMKSSPPALPVAVGDDTTTAATGTADAPADVNAVNSAWSGNKNFDALRDALQRAPNYAP